MAKKKIETILAIDTATEICSVALLGREETIYTKESDKGRNHAALISGYVCHALDVADEKNCQIVALAINAGPGSYTGLRIGSSFAKGFCFARQIPMIAINGLEILAHAYKKYHSSLGENTILCPMIDARRMEVYYAVFDSQLREISSPGAMIVSKDTLASIANNNHLICFGNGALKCQNEAPNNEVSFEDMPSVAHLMQASAFNAFDKKVFVDTAYWEPDYIKDYKAIRSVNKVIHI